MAARIIDFPAQSTDLEVTVTLTFRRSDALHLVDVDVFPDHDSTEHRNYLLLLEEAGRRLSQYAEDYQEVWLERGGEAVLKNVAKERSGESETAPRPFRRRKGATTPDHGPSHGDDDHDH